MSYNKAQIYNMTLSALLLAKKVENPDTDKSTEVSVLNTFWDTALDSTLKDLDLDSLSQSVQLELIAELDNNPHWRYVYKYPDTCAFFRRIRSCVLVDNRYTQIPKRVGLHNGVRAIFTNEYNAIAEIIPNNISLAALNANAALALAHKLATLSAPLIVGKGARALMETLERKYVIYKTEAQEDDERENFNFEDESVRSEFVQVRTS